jgi:hypothetical protein
LKGSSDYASFRGTNQPKGGLRALKKFLPAIFFEDNDVKYSPDVSAYAPTSEKMQNLYIQLLQPLGYACTQQHVDIFNRANFRGQSFNIFGSQASVVIECIVKQGGSDL